MVYVGNITVQIRKQPAHRLVTAFKGNGYTFSASALIKIACILTEKGSALYGQNLLTF